MQPHVRARCRARRACPCACQCLCRTCCGQAGKDPTTQELKPGQHKKWGMDQIWQPNFLRPGKKVEARQGQSGPQLPLRQHEENFTTWKHQAPLRPASPSSFPLFISIAELPCKFSSFALSSSLTLPFCFYTNSSSILVCIPPYNNSNINNNSQDGGQRSDGH